MSSSTLPGIESSDWRFGEKNSCGVGWLLACLLIFDPATALIDPDFYFSGEAAPPWAAYCLFGMSVGGMDMVL